jgi:hypothetical protein
MPPPVSAPESAPPWPDDLLLLMPVVLLDFLDDTFLDFVILVLSVAPAPALPSLEAPAAGCVCADAMVLTPTNEAATRAASASLDRMRNISLTECLRDSEPATSHRVPADARGIFLNIGNSIAGTRGPGVRSFTGLLQGCNSRAGNPRKQPLSPKFGRDRVKTLRRNQYPS